MVGLQPCAAADDDDDDDDAADVADATADAAIAADGTGAKYQLP